MTHLEIIDMKAIQAFLRLNYESNSSQILYNYLPSFFGVLCLSDSLPSFDQSQNIYGMYTKDLKVQPVYSKASTNRETLISCILTECVSDLV